MSDTERDRLAEVAAERARVLRARLEGMTDANKAYHALRHEASDFERIAEALRGAAVEGTTP